MKVIVSIIKDEHLFLKEWLDYHLSLGFDKIFLFEDYGSTTHIDITNKYNNVILNSVESFGIHIKNHTQTQFNLYKKFLQEAQDIDWILYIDIDEFLMFEEGYDLNRLCKEYEEKPAIWLSWKMYNANGHIKRPTDGVLHSYTQTTNNFPDNLSCWHVKSLVNVKLNKGMETNHMAIGGERTNGDSGLFSECCYNKAWINHYFCKSFEDYVYRMTKRGNMQNNNRSYDQFFDANPEMLDKQIDLLNSVRNIHLKDTMWISRKLKLISGGNLEIINTLENERNI